MSGISGQLWEDENRPFTSVSKNCEMLKGVKPRHLIYSHLFYVTEMVYLGLILTREFTPNADEGCAI